ncbi:hypothetical protein CYMTET_20939, partial [Cymbomonas tetramitiformis]
MQQEEASLTAYESHACECCGGSLVNCAHGCTGGYGLTLPRAFGRALHTGKRGDESETGKGNGRSAHSHHAVALSRDREEKTTVEFARRQAGLKSGEEFPSEGYALRSPVGTPTGRGAVAGTEASPFFLTKATSRLEFGNVRPVPVECAPGAGEGRLVAPKSPTHAKLSVSPTHAKTHSPQAASGVEHGLVVQSSRARTSQSERPSPKTAHASVEDSSPPGVSRQPRSKSSNLSGASSRSGTPMSRSAALSSSPDVLELPQ